MSALAPRGLTLLAFCVWTVVLVPATVAAQADAGFEGDIRRLLELMGSQALSEQIVTAASDNYTTLLRAVRPDLSPRAFEIANEVTKAAYAKATQPTGPLTARIVALYAKHFTHDDVRALIAFHQTETGRKLVRVLPSIALEAMRCGQEWALEVAPEIGAEVERRLRAEGIVIPPATARSAERKGPFDTLFDPKAPAPANREPPQLLRQVLPAYTRSARANGVEGIVILECVVQIDGGVQGCKVVRSLDPGLDEEAITAASKWQFVPGRQDGRAVPVIVTLEMRFDLRAMAPAAETPTPASAGAGPPPPEPAPPPPAPPRFEKGHRYVLEGKLGLAAARLVFEYVGDGPLTADLTVEGYYGVRQPNRLTGSLVGVNLRLSAGDVKIEGTFNGATVTGSFQLNATTGGTLSLSAR